MPYLYSHIVVHLILCDRDRFGFLMVKSNGLVKLRTFVMFQIGPLCFSFRHFEVSFTQCIGVHLFSPISLLIVNLCKMTEDIFKQLKLLKRHRTLLSG